MGPSSAELTRPVSAIAGEVCARAGAVWKQTQSENPASVREKARTFIDPPSKTAIRQERYHAITKGKRVQHAPRRAGPWFQLKQPRILVGSGESADALQVSVKTVEFHRSRFSAKLGASSVGDLTRFAIQDGLIAGPEH